MNNTDSDTKIIAIAAGIIYGIFLFVFAILLAGAGHGWCGAALGGFIAIFTTPKIVGSLFKVPLDRFKSSVILLIIFALLDVFLYWSAAFDEHTYFVRVRDGAILWLTLLSVPQILLLVVFLRDKHRLNPT